VPRPKKSTVVTVAPPGSDAAQAEVWQHINTILIFANQSRTHSPHATPEGAALDQTLQKLFTPAGEIKLSSPFFTLMNLVHMVHSEAIHIRVCPECNNWFLSRSKAKQICHRPACTLAVKRRRAADERQRELQQQRIAKRNVRR
jgi:hypothetical protein